MVAIPSHELLLSSSWIIFDKALELSTIWTGYTYFKQIFEN